VSPAKVRPLAEPASYAFPDQFKLIELSAKANLTDAEFDTMVAHSVRPGIAAGDKVRARLLAIRAAEP
jgi:hypothetical protein